MKSGRIGWMISLLASFKRLTRPRRYMFLFPSPPPSGVSSVTDG
jgi:hypothetical protein